MKNCEVAAHVKESLKIIPCGTKPEEIQNAKDFYKYFFTNFPDLRKYFKGAESFTADDVQKSERFDKQGARILLAMHILADTYEDEATFKAYARETVNRHKMFKMDPSLWLAFFTVYQGFLETKKPLTDEQKCAWAELGKAFADECNKHLEASGLPHV